MSKWIDKRDRLPENGQRIVVTGGQTYYATQWHDGIDEVGWTHWIPLPDLPKKKKFYATTHTCHPEFGWSITHHPYSPPFVTDLDGLCEEDARKVEDWLNKNWPETTK